MQAKPTLLFINNIDSAVLLSVHDYTTSRPAAPAGEVSHLFTLTYSPLGMKKEWKRFLKELMVPARTLDRDEFEREFGLHTITFPAVLLWRGTELSIFISTEEINQCQETRDLIDLVNERLARIPA